jgi:small-conductance mechanosensitive channel
MNISGEFTSWIEQNPTLYSVIKYVIWVILIALFIQFLRRFLRKKLPDNILRYKAQKTVEILGYFLIIILTISYFTGNIRDFTLAIGLISAGIAVTLQELILSVAGSVYILVVKLYSPGDRIEMNGIKGDVIDIDSMYTTMMEIGMWVHSDNYTGRIVKLTNAYVFKGPIYNYTQDFPFLWDEINLPIRYGSDLSLAKELIMNVANQTLQKYTDASTQVWKDVVQKYYIEDAQLAPTIAVLLTDNWINLNLRYIVDHKHRRRTKNQLNEAIYEAILKTNGKVNLASTTIELVSPRDSKD